MEGFEMQSASSLGDIIKIYEDNKELIQNSKTFGESIERYNFNELVEDMKAINMEGESLVLQRYECTAVLWTPLSTRVAFIFSD
eukprot:scaffold40486_cov33-Attheya_sp.AAC.1